MVAPLAVKLVNAVVAPTAPLKLIAPLVPAVNVRVFALLIVLLKLILAPAEEPPPFVVSIVVLAPNNAAPVTPNVLAVVKYDVPFNVVLVLPV